MQEDVRAIYEWVNNPPPPDSDKIKWITWWTSRPAGSFYRLFENAHAPEDHGVWREGDLVSVKVKGMDVVGDVKI